MNQNRTQESELSESEGEWLVAMGDQPTPMTLDELDEAFRDGAIDEGTLVWATGMPAWIPLGELASAPGDAAHLEALHGHEPEQSDSMGDDEMPKVDPRLWNLSSDDAGARRLEMKHDHAMEEEMELGSDDLDDDDTPCGIPPSVLPAATFTPGLGTSSLPPRKVPRHAATKTVSTPPRGLPPPRSRSVAPASSAFESLPPIPPAAFQSLSPIPNITAFESTAPLARTLSEPVIPIQKPPPGWNWRPWAAAAGMLFGLGAYGLSVLDLASSSPSASQRPGASVVAAQTLPEPEPEPARPAAPPPAAEMASASPPVTAAIMPAAAQVAADDASGLAREPEALEQSAVAHKGKKKKKARAKSWKKKKVAAKAKATRSTRTRPAAAAAAYKFLGMN